MSWGVGLTISAIIFPFFSSWVWGNILWGGGWLKNIGFIDFAGSTVVHSAAAWVLLAGYLTLKFIEFYHLQLQVLFFGSRGQD